MMRHWKEQMSSTVEKANEHLGISLKFHGGKPEVVSVQKLHETMSIEIDSCKTRQDIEEFCAWCLSKLSSTEIYCMRDARSNHASELPGWPVVHNPGLMPYIDIGDSIKSIGSREGAARDRSDVDEGEFRRLPSGLNNAAVGDITTYLLGADDLFLYSRGVALRSRLNCVINNLHHGCLVRPICPDPLSQEENNQPCDPGDELCHRGLEAFLFKGLAGRDGLLFSEVLLQRQIIDEIAIKLVTMLSSSDVCDSPLLSHRDREDDEEVSGAIKVLTASPFAEMFSVVQLFCWASDFGKEERSISKSRGLTDRGAVEFVRSLVAILGGCVGSTDSESVEVKKMVLLVHVNSCRRSWVEARLHSMEERLYILERTIHQDYKGDITNSIEAANLAVILASIKRLGAQIVNRRRRIQLQAMKEVQLLKSNHLEDSFAKLESITECAETIKEELLCSVPFPVSRCIAFVDNEKEKLDNLIATLKKSFSKKNRELQDIEAKIVEATEKHAKLTSQADCEMAKAESTATFGNAELVSERCDYITNAIRGMAELFEHFTEPDKPIYGTNSDAMIGQSVREALDKGAGDISSIEGLCQEIGIFWQDAEIAHEELADLEAKVSSADERDASSPMTERGAKETHRLLRIIDEFANLSDSIRAARLRHRSLVSVLRSKLSDLNVEVSRVESFLAAFSSDVVGSATAHGVFRLAAPGQREITSENAQQHINRLGYLLRSQFEDRFRDDGDLTNTSPKALVKMLEDHVRVTVKPNIVELSHNENLWS